MIDLRQPAFRVYVLNGCQHCAAVLDQFATFHVEPEVILIGQDPVLLNGISSVAGGSVVAPTIISFINHEIILGGKSEDIIRVIKLYLDLRAGAVARDPLVADGERVPEVTPA